MSAKFVWANGPDFVVGHLQGVVRKRKLQVARQIFNGFVMRTPVDTGSARASWRVSLGAPDTSITVNNTRGVALPPPSFPLTDVPAYSKLYISNATPYIIKLEYGWSKQAPAGMMRVTLAGLRISSIV